MGHILSSEVVVDSHDYKVDELFRKIQNANLTSTEVLQLKHRLEALMQTMQEADFNRSFRRLESKLDYKDQVEHTKVTIMTARLDSMDLDLQYQREQGATLLRESKLQLTKLAELKAMLPSLLAERTKKV